MRDWARDPDSLGTDEECRAEVAGYLRDIPSVIRTIDRMYNTDQKRRAGAMERLLADEIRNMVDGAMGLNDGVIESLIQDAIDGGGAS